MKNILASAKLVREYYKIVDANPEGVEYHLRVHNFKSIVITKFDNHYSRENNPVVSLFQTLLQLEESVHDLDSMGLEMLANELDVTRSKVDANLRAIVDHLLDGEVTSGWPHDVEFVKNAVPKISSPVVWLETYRNKQKYIPK